MRTIFASLRSRLILLIVLTFIPAVVLLFQTGLKQREQAVEAAEQEAIHLANMASNLHTLMGSSVEAFLLTVAHNPMLRQNDVKGCQDLFPHLVTEHFNYYASFYVADLAGNIVCSPPESHDTPNFQGCDHYATLIEADDFIVNGYHICKRSGKAVLSIGYPIRDLQNQRILVTNVSLDLTWFYDFARDSNLPEGSELIMVDQQGTILSHYPDNERWRGFPLPESTILPQLNEQKEGVQIGAGFDGTDSIYVISPMQGSLNEISIILGRPTRLAFAQANQTLQRNLLSLMLVMLGMIFITWKLADALIIKQTDRLVRATRQLEQGDLSVRTGIAYSSGEFGELAQAFDRMANQLAIREQERDLHVQQLKEYARNLELSNKDLSDFAFIASHDLQEPLRKILIFSDLLQENYTGTLEARGVDYLRRMQEAALRMKLLLGGLLAFSRVTTKFLPYNQVDLNQTLKQVLADLDLQIEEKQALVQVSNLPTIEADPLQLNQLMQNLISNSIKFHKPDCPPVVRITGMTPDGAANANEMCEIRIEDEGIGFDEKHLKRIFQPFQRVHARKDYAGLGMGLAICNKIVNLHGGTITAHSRVGVGSTFIIQLPVHQNNERQGERWSRNQK